MLLGVPCEKRMQFIEALFNNLKSLVQWLSALPAKLQVTGLGPILDLQCFSITSCEHMHELRELAPIALEDNYSRNYWAI